MSNTIIPQHHTSQAQFDALWAERPAVASIVDKEVARSFFNLGQQTPRPTIMDQMLSGIEQDGLRQQRKRK